MYPKKTCTAFILAAIAPLLVPACCLGMPKAERIELPNHLKVLVFEEHSIPAVTMELLVAAGSWRDPDEMKGIANLTAKSVLMGTRSLSFDEINSRLDFMGASLEADCTRDFATIGMQVLKKDLESGVGLFTEIIAHPSFPGPDVDGQKDDIIGSLRAKEDDPIEVANRAFDRALFLDSPYASPVDGTEKSVPEIGADELSKFYASFYRPNDSVLVVGGDISTEEVKTMIVPRLIGWEAAQVPETPFRKKFAQGAVNVAIDKPVSQATIIIGCPAMERASQDYYPFLVMNQILGSGDLSSRLMIEIRIKKGLAYAVESYPSARKYAGSFQVVIQTKDLSAKESIALAREQLVRLRRQPVSDAELQAAKKFLIGNFPLKYSAQQDYAKLLAQIEFYGLGADYIEKFASLINAVTSEDILRVADKYLKPDNVTVIVADLKKARIE
ncbi:MAG TPA: pitrilysin family protein [Syntrophobacteraceae bacterium]|nr:pitrilysin family protein [Syntrophobacteraceae bacterium]